jgi:hypothetical protein
VQKLQEELKYESETVEAQVEPEFLKDFKAGGIWTVRVTC